MVKNMKVVLLHRNVTCLKDLNSRKAWQLRVPRREPLRNNLPKVLVLIRYLSYITSLSLTRINDVQLLFSEDKRIKRKRIKFHLKDFRYFSTSTSEKSTYLKELRLFLFLILCLACKINFFTLRGSLRWVEKNLY